MNPIMERGAGPPLRQGEARHRNPTATWSKARRREPTAMVRGMAQEPTATVRGMAQEPHCDAARHSTGTPPRWNETWYRNLAAMEPGTAWEPCSKGVRHSTGTPQQRSEARYRATATARSWHRTTTLQPGMAQDYHQDVVRHTIITHCHGLWCLPR